jgi:hypothetical protein
MFPHSSQGTTKGGCMYDSYIDLFPQVKSESCEYLPGQNKIYKPVLTVSENAKGVIDIDTVKGCELGLKAYPRGCYNECYANKTANRYGIDFSVSVSRKIDYNTFQSIFKFVKNHKLSWYRVGTAGDPCHDWDNTIYVCGKLKDTGKIPVIITKHWLPLSPGQLIELKKLNAVINTSTSGMDSPVEIEYRVKQINRIKKYGIKSVCRVVTCEFGTSEWALRCKKNQDYLLSLEPVIDNPLRATNANHRVKNGDIILTKMNESVGGEKFISLNSETAYLGKCKTCPDQCGIDFEIITTIKNERNKMKGKRGI